MKMTQKTCNTSLLLKREQYGSAPILNGPYWNSEMASQDEWNDLSAYYLRRWVVKMSDADIKVLSMKKMHKDGA